MPPSTIFHLGHIVAEFRRSPTLVEHHHRHHTVVLTELIPEALLDRSPGIIIVLNVVLNSEVPYVRCLDRSDREDVRLHQPRCHNASAYGLRGYVVNTLSSRCYAITMILRVRRKLFEITTFPNSGIRA